MSTQPTTVLSESERVLEGLRTNPDGEREPVLVKLVAKLEKHIPAGAIPQNGAFGIVSEPNRPHRVGMAVRATKGDVEYFAIVQYSCADDYSDLLGQFSKPIIFHLSYCADPLNGTIGDKIQAALPVYEQDGALYYGPGNVAALVLTEAMAMTCGKPPTGFLECSV